MYEQTDKVIRYLNKRFIRIFNKARVVLDMDELHILNHSHGMYEELLGVTTEQYLKLAKRTYRKYSAYEDWDMDMAWLLGLLDEYDPVTKYVFLHEVDRKRARFAESVIASPTKEKEIKVSLRYWSQMVNQYAITVTDRAALKAYEDMGVEEVIWVTTPDERRCKVCAGREGKVYKIDKAPAKPHWGCRCYLRPKQD